MERWRATPALADVFDDPTVVEDIMCKNLALASPLPQHLEILPRRFWGNEDKYLIVFWFFFRGVKVMS